jgi:3-hydroxyisobutyrate dehydrogenase
MPGAETAFALFDLLCSVGGSRLGGQALSLLYADEADGYAAGLDWSLIEDAADDSNDDERRDGERRYRHYKL